MYKALRQLHFIVFPLFVFLPIPHGTSIPLRRRPVVTSALVWVNIIVFLVTRYSGDYSHFEDILHQFGYTPSEGRLLTLFTYQFLHGGWLHVLGNMLFLWIFGANVEDRLGRLGFLVFYLASGMAAMLFWERTISVHQANEPCVGASGAMYGVMGAFFTLYPFAEVRITYIVMLLVVYWRVRTIPTAALFIAPFFVLMNILFDAISQGVSVAFMAHVGGFLFAVPCMLFFRSLFPETRRRGPAPQLSLEEEVQRSPQSEPERLVRELKEALFARSRTRAIQLYREGCERFGTVSLLPVDMLQLGEAMIWEKEHQTASEVYKRLAADEHVDPSLRAQAALQLGRLYIGPLGDVPRGAKILRKALEKLPPTPPCENIRRELSELEQKGYPVNW